MTLAKSLKSLARQFSGTPPKTATPAPSASRAKAKTPSVANAELVDAGQLEPVARYFAGQVSYLEELLGAVQEQVRAGGRALDGAALAAKIDERRAVIADRSLALALNPTKKQQVAVPTALAADGGDTGAKSKVTAPAIDTAERLESLAAVYRKRNLRSLLEIKAQLDTVGSRAAPDVVVDAVNFLLATEYLVPDLATELGERLIAHDETYKDLPKDLRQLVLTKLAVAHIKTGGYDQARARWANLKALSGANEAALHLQFADLVWRSDPEAALVALEFATNLGAKISSGYFQLHLMLTLDLRGPEAAERLFAKRQRVDTDASYGLYNIALRRDGFVVAQGFLQHIYRMRDLAIPRFEARPRLDVNAMASDLSDVDAVDTIAGQRPLVTVVMTAFNAAETIEGALRSLQLQSYSNIEIIVVDDLSTDGTVEVVRGVQARDPRIRLLTNRGNIGTYLSRNRALKQARGEFVTFQDSDDWSHPSRIALHLAEMIGDPHLVLTKSHWIRMMPNGAIPLRRWSRSFAHTNPSSLFIRTAMLPVIGYFDAVRADADFEIARRIDLLFAPAAIRTLQLPLSIGFVGEETLTKSGPTAMDDEGFSPVRAAYKRAWMLSYPERLNRGALPHPALPNDYGYEVPAEMAVNLADTAAWFDEPAEELTGLPQPRGEADWNGRPPFWFAISLASAQSSPDWARTQEVFGNTLHSILNQDDPDFRVLVAGHERPDVPEMDDPRVEFIISDRKPPSVPKDFRADKMWKRRLILQRIKTAGGGFMAPIDADDLLSSKLVSYIRAREVRHGFLVTRGYALNWADRVLASVPGAWDVPFERVCGSSAVFLLRPDDIPHLYQQDVSGIAAAIVGPHANWRLTAEEVGQPFEEIDFPASIYVLNTAVNLSFARQRAGDRSDSLMRNLLRAQVEPTPELVREFALERLFPELAGGGAEPGEHSSETEAVSAV